jgi:pyridoxal phosphate enzyme (YggS family)
MAFMVHQTDLTGDDLAARIGERLRAVRERVAAAAERAGRNPEEITLVAVTKSHPPEAVAALLSLGQTSFGENRVQEALAKIEALGGRGEWHFIGHLQRNKAAQIVGRMVLIHSVDSVRLIEELEKQAAKKQIEQRILLELNVAREANKTGAAPEDLPVLLEALASAPHLRAEGLMTMAPYSDDPEKARPYFVNLHEILRAAPKLPHFSPRHLSMGMSGDYEVAIEEGSTIIRVGTAILGERS